MGQQTIGILFGIEIPDDLHILEDYGEYEGPGLLDRWEEAMSEEIETLRTSGTLARFESPKWQLVPDVEGDSSLMGFWLAAGGSGKGGCPYLVEGPVRLDPFTTTSPYAEFYLIIQERWNRFAKWAKESEGIELPEPALWMTETEVA